MTAPMIGIDLGTTNSLAAFMHGGKPVVIRDDSGTAIVPSVVTFRKDGQPLVGLAAQEQRYAASGDTVYAVKRLMGKDITEVEAETRSLAYDVVPADRSLVKVKTVAGEFTPQEVSACILREIQHRASDYFGEPITQAVITVPAYFDDAQRQATRDAGRIAGLDVQRIVNEPTAAALAYGLDTKQEGTIAIYDLGGGTFDFSILQLADGVFQVVATNGDTHLGGHDFDHLLVTLAAEDIAAAHDVDILSDSLLMQRAIVAAERCKIALSDSEASLLTIELPSGEAYERKITRDEFIERISPLIARTLSSCRQALKDADLVAKQIDEVVLVGGSTRIPFVQKTVSEFFQAPVHHEINPDEVVALGAAVQAGILSGDSREVLLLDVVPLSLGIETMGGAMAKLIMRNTSIPAQATEEFSTYVDNQTGVDINIFQGERELVEDCRNLGRFTLGGIPPMPAGMPRIQVKFTIDANGILTVTARERTSGRAATVEVVPSHGLTDDEVNALVEESVVYARDDMQAHRLIDLRNETTSIARATRKVLADPGLDIAASLRAEIEQALAELEALSQTDDANAIYAKQTAFNELTQPLAQAQMNSVLDATVVERTIRDVTGSAS